MRCCQLAILCVLTAAPLHNLAKPLAPHWDHIRVKHSWNNVPPHWESLGHPPAGTTIDLNIVLMPYNENALIDALYDVSDPKSVKYGSHLSKEQVNRLIAPHQNTLDLVHSWLGYHDIPSSSISMTRGGSWLTLKGVPISQANKLLGASYQLYRHAGTNDTAIPRTIGYSLPTALHAHVQTVIPTTYLSTRTPWQTPLKHSANSTANMESRGLLRMLSIRDDHINIAVTPSSLRSLYRMTAYVPAATDKNVLAIVAFRNQYPSLADFEQFMTTCRSDVANPLAAFTHVEVNGGTFDLGKPGPGANANMQYTVGLAYPTPIRFYSVGGEITVIVGTDQPARSDMILEWLLLMLDEETVPQTITMSYGEFEKFIPFEYADAICKMFAELGSRGASVLVASGNDGVGPSAKECSDSSGRLRFPIEFPTSCPWVTSVGGTKNQVFRAEVAAPFSGGGFSIYFPRPDYQDDAVKTFLEKENDQPRTYRSYYNPHGRGIPDISAQAVNYYTIHKGRPRLSSSTSCAASTVASIISLLNDYRISTSRKPLGFLNLWLYGHGREGLYDVIHGLNPGCGTYGFAAIPGWDPVTGLGTPDFLLLQYTLDYIPVN
ncbi:subtilisin-like protein [Lactarius quietus]|nr:subtilisin-like protein [Lactarius quietus]